MAEIEVIKNILGENDRVAAENQAMFAKKGVYVLNLMGSPGAGKTSVLEKTRDAERIEKHGVPVIQINTAGGCHLDAPMVQKVAQKLALDAVDLLIVENVGNLVCPAEFAIGEDDKAVVLSITEGDDKPMKYPLIFKESAIALLNKVDILPYCDFDMAAAKEDILTLHPGMQVMEISCTKGQGVAAWCDWLLAKVTDKKEQQV